MSQFDDSKTSIDYMNQTMKANLMLGTAEERDLDFGSLADMRDYLLNPGQPDAGYPDNALTWLVEQQGYTKGEFHEAYGVCEEYGFVDCENMYGSFLASASYELGNFPNVMGAVTVLSELTLNDIVGMQAPEVEITMPKDTKLGIFNPWLGGGSMMEIQLEKPLAIPADKCFDIQIEGAQGNAYTVSDVYGLEDTAWKRPLSITNPEQERPLDDLKREASERAAEKNQPHAAPDKSQKPPSPER